MSAYKAELVEGEANPKTNSITGYDSLHDNKKITLTFHNACPGTGIDAALGTSIQLSSACYQTLATAVTNSHKVRLEGTQSSTRLSAIIHSILP